MTLEEIDALAEEENKKRVVREPCYEVLVDDRAGRFRKGEIGYLVYRYPKGEKYAVQLNLGTLFARQLFTGDYGPVVKYERAFMFREDEVKEIECR